jgi:hypothetical protein
VKYLNSFSDKQKFLESLKYVKMGKQIFRRTSHGNAVE